MISSFLCFLQVVWPLILAVILIWFNDILLHLFPTGRVAFDFGSEGSPRGNSVGHNYPYDAMQGESYTIHNYPYDAIQGESYTIPW